MFPLPWNKAFRKKDGSLTTLDEAISEGGGSYTLPTASANTKGAVKIGSGLTMTGEVLSADDQLPASTSADEDKVLTVGSDGTPGWATPGGGGGGGLSYIDLSLGSQVRVAATAFKSDYILTIGAESPLIGKRIVNVLTPSASVFCVGVSSYQSNPIALNSQIRLLFYNASSEADGVTELRIFYM